MTTTSVGRAVVGVLEAEGVTTVFGIPGGHVLPIYDAVYSSSQVASILVRHEHCAAAMAAGYAQLTGMPGVVVVTAGPGVTNVVTAVAEAFVGALPMVILAGRGSTATVYRGASQEVSTDQVLRPITKWSTRVDRTDLAVAMRRYTEVLHIGRWFRRGPFIPGRALYRGGQAAAELSLARAFSGDSMIELIEQHNEAPSVYREVIDVRGFGFHHWAIPTRSFDEDTGRYQAQGFEVAYSDVLDTGARINYLDAVSSIGGMVELVELTPTQLDRYTLFYLSSVGWDGTEPVREG